MSVNKKVVRKLDSKCKNSSNFGDASLNADARNVQRLINLLLAIIKQKTNKLVVKLLPNLNLFAHFRRGSQIVSNAMFYTLANAVNKIMNDDFDAMVNHSRYPDPVMKCCSFNNLFELEVEPDNPTVYHQWQVASYRTWKYRANLQSNWKNRNFMRPKSRCNSQLQYFSSNTLTNSPSTEEDDLDELLDCERFSQISGSAITVSGIGDPSRIQHMEQQLADLQKMMGQLLQAQQLKKDSNNTVTTNYLNSSSEQPLIKQKEHDSALFSTSIPPPPPPLPPDFLRSKASTSLISSTSVARKNPMLDLSTSNKNIIAPSLKDVLKDLHSVKLKKVDITRSPNGTPMRKKGSLSVDEKNLDGGSSTCANASSEKYFKMALNKMFQNVRAPSESFTDTENDDADTSTVWDEEECSA